MGAALRRQDRARSPAGARVARLPSVCISDSAETSPRSPANITTLEEGACSSTFPRRARLCDLRLQAGSASLRSWRTAARWSGSAPATRMREHGSVVRVAGLISHVARVDQFGLADDPQLGLPGRREAEASADSARKATAAIASQMSTTPTRVIGAHPSSLVLSSVTCTWSGPRLFLAMPPAARAGKGACLTFISAH